MNIEKFTTACKIMEDATRVRILCLIYHFGECSITDLALTLGIMPQKTYRHLRYLPESNYITEREGNAVYYRLNDLDYYMITLVELASKTADVRVDINRYEQLRTNGDLLVSGRHQVA